MLNKKIILYVLVYVVFSCSAVFAAEQVRVGIIPFASRTEEISESQAASVTDMITGFLHASPSIAIIERERLRVAAMEQGFSASNNDSVAKLGQILGCKYILLGAVTQLTQRYLSTTKYTSFLFDKIYDGENESQEFTAKLEARLIDVVTGRIVLSFTQSGSAIVSSGQKYSHRDMVMRAIAASSTRLCDEVREILVNEYPSIIAINKNNIRINRGRDSGVSIGSLYKVYQDGEEIFDLNGKTLGKKKINLALLRVVKVQNDFSDAVIVDNDSIKNQNTKNTGKKPINTKNKKKNKKAVPEQDFQEEEVKLVLIREGDKIEAISFTEAEKLKLASQRIGEDK